MLDWIQTTMDALGYPGVAVLMVIENVFPPIPSELIMPLAGFTAAQGRLTLWGVVAAGTVGSVVGALPLYYLGARLGEDRLVAWAERHGTWLAVSGGDIRRAGAWLDRKGRAAVFVCRLVPGVRSLISVPAGVARMPLGVFLLYTALGTGLWAGALAYAGVLLGENYDRVEGYVGPVSYVVFGLLAAALVVRAVRRRRTPPPPEE